MTVVSSLLATLGIQPDKASFAQANGLLGGLESKVGKVAGVLGAAFAGGQVVGYFRDLVAEGDKLNDLISKTGMSGQALQALGFAAEQNGSSLEGVTNALTRLSITSEQAAEGSKSAQESFRALGFSARELKEGLPTEEILARIADKIAATDNPAQRAALSFKAFGKQGAALLPFLKNGREGIEQLQQEFKKLGGGLSDDFISKADEVNDELARLKVSTNALGSSLGVLLLPTVISIVKKLTDWALVIRDLLKGSQFLESALLVGAAAFVAWGIASLWASKAARQKLGLIGTMAALAAVLDEIKTAMMGGKTLIGSWIDKWAGLGTVDRWVRSIGGGLKMIHEMIQDGSLKQLPGFSEIAAAQRQVEKMAALQGQIQGVAANIAGLEKQTTTNPIDEQVRKNMLVKERARLKMLQEQQFGFQENTARSVGPGLHAAAEVIQAGQASASAVNEGAAATLFGVEGTAVQTADGKVRIVEQKSVTVGDVNVTAKTNASPREIGRHVKRAVRHAIDKEADDIQRSRGRRDQSPDADDVGGDSSIEGLD